jgi:hypothetical protein
LEACGAALFGMFSVRVSVATVPALMCEGFAGVIEHCPDNALASQVALTEPL